MPAFDSQRNVFLLPLLGAAAEQNDDSLSVFSEIDPVAWTEINADFKDPAADALRSFPSPAGRVQWSLAAPPRS
jgi:hypothetical protein